MALDVYVCGVPSGLQGPCWRVEASWWNGWRLLNDERFRPLPWDRSAAVLGPDDVLELNRSFLRNGISERVREWGKALEERITAERDKLAFLVVLVSECDSGYG